MPQAIAIIPSFKWHTIKLMALFPPIVILRCYNLGIKSELVLLFLELDPALEYQGKKALWTLHRISDFSLLRPSVFSEYFPPHKYWN